MTKRNLIFIMILALTLTALLSGCSRGEDNLEGKNIATFYINGGTLNYGTSSTNTKIHFAYHPGTYVVDPTTIPNYSITRNGYNFTGWYTSEDCKPGEKWDFSKALDAESLVLYAGWEKAIRYSYTLYYTDEENEISLGTYQVSAGEKFEDWRRFAAERDNHTCIGYFSDAACTVAWDFDFAHPGGSADLDIPVYAQYIEGDWELVDSYDELKRAVNSGNVYLTADIDCGGKELFFTQTFNRVFEGNGYKISNFTVNRSGSPFNPSAAIFKTIGEKADMRNVTFENMTIQFTGIPESTDKVEVKVNVSALAINMNAGAKISNVSVAGKLITDYNGEFPCLNEVYCYKGDADPAILEGVTDFTANIVIEKQ